VRKRVRRLSAAVHSHGREQEAVVQALKAGLAAVLALLAAAAIGGAQPFLAPYARCSR
jgi:hypothetical protein